VGQSSQEEVKREKEKRGIRRIEEKEVVYSNDCAKRIPQLGC
jgi:hypothetical protein